MQDMSPVVRARLAGFFYLLSVASAVLTEAFVHGNALYAAGLVPVLCFAVVTFLLYIIFRPASRPIALLALLFNFASLSLEALEIHLGRVNAALILHGVYCLLIAWAFARSAFLPRFLAALIAIAGLAWIAASFPAPAPRVHNYAQAIGFIGEGLPMLWLLVRGVNGVKWNEQSLKHPGHSRT